MLIFIFLKLIGSLALLLCGVTILNKGARRWLIGSCAVAKPWMSRRGWTFSFPRLSSLRQGTELGAAVGIWLLAVLGFRLDAGLHVFPLFVLAYPLYRAKGICCREAGRLLFGFSFLFLSLSVFYHGLQSLTGLPGVPWHASGVWSVLLWTVVGLVPAMFLRSATLFSTIALGLCATGLADVGVGAALLAGAGVGVLIPVCTPSCRHGKRADESPARERLVHRVVGLLWLLLVFRPFIDGCGRLAGWLAPAVSPGMAAVYALATFLTCYRVCNVVLVQALVKPLVRLYRRRSQARRGGDAVVLPGVKGVRPGRLAEPPKTVREQVQSVAGCVCELFDELKRRQTDLGRAESSGLMNRIRKKRRDCLRMQAQVLKVPDAAVAGEHPGIDEGAVKALCGEMDALGDALDSCERMADILGRLHLKHSLTSKQREHLTVMFQFAGEALLRMRAVLGEEGADADATLSFGIEQEMDSFHAQLLAQDAMDMRDPAYDGDLSRLYTSLISECEAFGNCVVRVVEAHTGTTRPV